jgi:tRNA-Thr(GGU) m(6)t(6)A37 methyltransferase TsaA
MEGGPEAELQIDPALAEGLSGIEPGCALILLTWLHLGRRDVLKVHPKGDPSAELKGVFLTRSPDRPNPIGLHRVRVLAVEGCRLRVAPLEVLDGTPLADIKIAADGEA